MAPRLADILEEGIRPHLHLPGASVLAALPQQLGGFADAFSAGIECRLGTLDGAVDFGWTQHRRDFGAPQFLRGYRSWEAISEFTRLSRAGTVVFNPVEFLYFEVDQSSHGFGLEPSLFFGRIHGEIPQTMRLYRALAKLLNRRQDIRCETAFRRLLEAMPAASIAVCLGYMLSRPDAPLRLVLSEIEAQEGLPAYLEAIGWPGDLGRVRALISATPVLAACFNVGPAFDFNGSVLPRLGIEFTFKRHIDNGGLLKAATDELVAIGACLPQWQETLLAWGDGSAGSISRLGYFLGAGDRYKRWVSHFKITIDGSAIAAKAYLECFSHEMLIASRWQNTSAKRSIPNEVAP